jgi:ERCC4-related helicase
MPTPSSALPLIAPGAQVVIRDEEWLVRSVQHTSADGLMVKTIGTSELVRDQEATFFTELDGITPLRPEETTLVADATPSFRRSRLYLEALLRKTPLPISETRIAVGHHQLLDDLAFQRTPARLALEALRPRLLIADAVGLGKTLEVGILLSELIRRGRGDRILVVAPRHILEQFQHELWTRFAIALVRLDSEGIQRVRQKIPATRNPFTYYRRVIISIDTLKNAGRYRHHLEGIRWDAVVIDESHNLMNPGTLNNQLARVLAPRTDALILTSATPHNGKPESFAQLVRMLDPTAIANPKQYERADIEHLFVRRHKTSPDVATEVGSNWADRHDPIPVRVPASPDEEAVIEELAEAWLYPRGGRPPNRGGEPLFPYTLLKAFLSSHHALAETIGNRRKRLAEHVPHDNDARREDEALARLDALVDHVDDSTAGKLSALVRELQAVGVGPKSATRAVIFSERHATLEWLHRALPGLLRLHPDAVRILHGGLPDVRQQDIVEEFALSDTPVRVLLTGDIASEGVNLHRQCHQLIHFDLPWSLIRIEQRNGRIDRYGQRHRPAIRALLLAPGHDTVRGDLDLVARLLDKEHHAHRALGDSASLMGLYDDREEEAEITKAIAEHRDLDEMIPDTPRPGFDLMMILAGAKPDVAPDTCEPTSLFASDAAFLDEALREAFDDPERELDIHREAQHGLVTLTPPDDLKRRLDALPQSYLAEQKVLDRLRITTERHVAEEMLKRARESSDSIWPTVSYLSSQHPLLDWVTDKVLVRVGRNHAPVLVADVAEPTFLVQGVYSNKRGQATIVEWMAVDRLPRHPHVRPMGDVLAATGVHPGMSNPGHSVDLDPLQSLVPIAVGAARDYLRSVREERGQAMRERVKDHTRRLRRWQKQAEQLTLELGNIPLQKHRQKEIAATSAEIEALIDSLSTTGDPLVRICAVLVRRG